MFWAPLHQRKHVHLLPAIFHHFHLEERWGVDVQTWCDITKTVKIEVKLLLSANRKSHMLHRLAQQQMTLSDPEWPFPHRVLFLR